MIEAKHVHLVGAGGIGISAVGKWFLAQGVAVSGSDAKQTAITDDLVRRGVVVHIGHDATNVPDNCDLVVYTEAAGEDNPERAAATVRGIRQLSHFGFLAELAQGKRLICITGTHGKSTTTAMTGKIFIDAGLDPTVFVGSLVPGWELGNLHIGTSDILIVEGDEYKRKMLALSPETTVITNIEEDHLDIYKDLDDIVATFHQLVEQTRGSTFIHAGDVHSQRLSGSRVVAYAVEDIDGMTVGVPGAFNRVNAAAAHAVARAYHIPREVIAGALAAYAGIWRRFERVGVMAFPPAGGGIKGGGSADIISDYGHHPTAVKATLAAAREFFPGRRVVLAFQPHQHNRTKELFDEFLTAFNDADVLILAEIYGVAGRTDDDRISSKDLLAALTHPAAMYAKDLHETEVKIRAQVRDGDVVIVMGAGDIDDVARRLVR